MATLLVLCLPAACGPGRAGDAPAPSPEPPVPASSAVETVRATRWVATSAEYRALSLQAYQAALEHLREALRDSTWTAALEQEDGEYRHLPPAVILDVDETVLDNVAFQERLIRRDSDYDRAIWAEWVREASAPAIPGAKEFTRRAAQLGVAVFYVTNRDAEFEDPTLQNLVALGFPVAASRDALLTRGERPDWGSDKGSRRAYVAESFRVLLLVGDDLNDFVFARGLGTEDRDRLVDRYEERWGERWIVLPNPVYGSWERALGSD